MKVDDEVLARTLQHRLGRKETVKDQCIKFAHEGFSSYKTSNSLPSSLQSFIGEISVHQVRPSWSFAHHDQCIKFAHEGFSSSKTSNSLPSLLQSFIGEISMTCASSTSSDVGALPLMLVQGEINGCDVFSKRTLLLPFYTEGALISSPHLQPFAHIGTTRVFHLVF